VNTQVRGQSLQNLAFDVKIANYLMKTPSCLSMFRIVKVGCDLEKNAEITYNHHAKLLQFNVIRTLGLLLHNICPQVNNETLCERTAERMTFSRYIIDYFIHLSILRAIVNSGGISHTARFRLELRCL